MLKRFATRTIVLVVSLWLASIIIFAIMAVLPGDPAVVKLGVNAAPAQLAQLRHQFGTDRPLVDQYASWAGGILHGSFGTSYLTDAAIAPQIAAKLQVTLWLIGLGLIIALVIALPLGVVAAVRHRRADGAALAGVSQLGMAIPSFMLAILLIDVFAVRLRLVPSGGWTAPSEGVGMFLKQVALPVISLGLVQAALLSRYVRSATLDVLREDYIRTARSKGLSPTRAFLRHGLRNAAVPVVTVLGLQIAALLIDTIVIERVFVLPGLGSLLLDSVSQRDLLLVQGIVMVLVAAVLLINYVVDLVYVAIDPRLRKAT